MAGWGGIIFTGSFISLFSLLSSINTFELLIIELGRGISMFGVFGKFYGLINNFLMENLSMINKSHCDSVGEHK